MIRVRVCAVWLLAAIVCEAWHFRAVGEESAGAGDVRRQWAQWRGPLGTGEAPDAAPPTTWSETENLAWKVAIPGRGHSTPIVWNDRVFLTTAIPVGEELPAVHTRAKGAHDNIPVTRRHQFVVLALNRQDGSQVWSRVVREALPHDGGGHYTASLASASPVTDGQRIYVSFGSQGVYCLDWEGNIVWERDLGKMFPVHGHGEGSSPALAGDSVIINWDHERQSSVSALETETGATRWRAERNEITSWGSPIVIEFEGVTQVVVSGTRRIRGYDLRDGSVLWECGGLSTNIVASPVFAAGTVFAGSSYDTKALLAIDLRGARGDLTGTKHVVWSRNRATPYVPSPLLYAQTLYFTHHYQAVLIGVDAATGTDRPGAFRLPGITDLYASPVAASGRIYVTDRDGTTVVLEHGVKPKFLAENRLEDRFNASAAITGRQLFLRGERFLYCLEEK